MSERWAAIREKARILRENYDPDEDMINGGHQGLAQADFIDTIRRVAGASVAEKVENYKREDQKIPLELRGTLEDPRINCKDLAKHVVASPSYKLGVGTEENKRMFKEWLDGARQLGVPIRNYEDGNLLELKGKIADAQRMILDVVERKSPDLYLSLVSYLDSRKNGDGKNGKH